MAVTSLIESLDLLQLQWMPNEWSDWAWEREFMDINENPIPDAYALYLEDCGLDIGLSSARSAIDDWITSDKNASWQVLVEGFSLDTKKLLPALCYLISTGLGNPMDENWRRICVEAASLYFSFLSIPGSYPFMIFHPNLLSKALGCFKLGARLSVRPKKKPKITSNRRTNSQAQDVNELIDDSFQDGLPPLPESEKTYLIRDLNSIILNLILMLKKFSLNSQPDSLEHIVQRLVDVTRLEVTTCDFRFGRNTSYESARSTVFTLAYNAYTAIGSLCRSFHGKVQDTVTLVTQYLLPSIMMVPASGTAPTPKDLAIIKDHTVYFLQFLMLKLKDDADRGITILIQHLCTKVQDRAELRQKGSQVVVDLMRSLPMTTYSQLMIWIFKFAYHEKASHRLFALEVIAKLLHEVERCGDGDGAGAEPSPAELSFSHVGPLSEASSAAVGEDENGGCVVQRNLHRDVPSHRFLLAVILGRCCDSSGTVRTKALQTLVECTKSNNAGINALMNEIFVTPYVDVADVFQSLAPENDFICYRRFLRMLRDANNTHTDPLPGAKAVFKMLADRIGDDKVYVRKAALQVIENLMRFNQKCMTYDMLKTMSNFCRDPAVLVRKHMVRTLTDLLARYPDHALLPVMWVDSVLPRVVDPESTVQEKVLECLEELVIKNLIECARMSRPSQQLPFNILRIITANDKRTYLYNACYSWSKSNAINERIVWLVKSYVSTVNNEPAWVMLAAMSEYIDFDPVLVLEYYRDIIMPLDVGAKPDALMIGGLVAETLRNLWPSVATQHQCKLCTQLIENLSALNVAVPLIRPTVDLLLATPPIGGHPEIGVAKWAPRLVEECDMLWRDNVTLLCSGKATLAEATVFLKAQITYADAIQWCPKKLNEKTMQPIRKLWRELPDCEMTKTLGLRPALIVVIGKLCVTSDEFANVAVPFLGSLLKVPCPSVVKINIINVFYDMCIRCTSLVEPALGDICLSLRDRAGSVREKTLVTLIQLLQEDFLKIRPDLYYNLLTMLCDKQANIQSMASYYLTTCLSSKHPNFIYSHFVQSLFYYNNYQGHKSYSQSLAAGDMKQFHLDRPDRQLVYRFMLDTVTDDHRYSLTRKLCSDVLNGVNEGSVSLEGPGEELVRDTFYVLSSEEIRLSPLRSRLDDEPPVDESEMATVILASTRKLKLTELVKKNLKENTVPIIIRLKRKLDNKKSPLAADLMIYLRDLMKCYPTEIVDILHEDRALASQVQRDVRAWEEEERSSRARIREGARRGTAASGGTNDSSESDGGLSPAPSPGRPVVPVEVQQVMSNLTPGVRRNVEPFLANVCQQVMYHARAVSASPVTPVETPVAAPVELASRLQLLDSKLKSPNANDVRLPDGTRPQLEKLNRCSVVLEKIPHARVRLLVDSERKAHGNRQGKKAGGDSVGSSSNRTETGSKLRGGGVCNFSNIKSIRECSVVIERLDENLVTMSSGKISGGKVGRKRGENTRRRVSEAANSDRKTPSEGLSTNQTSVGSLEPRMVNSAFASAPANCFGLGGDGSDLSNNLRAVHVSSPSEQQASIGGLAINSASTLSFSHGLSFDGGWPNILSSSNVVCTPNSQIHVANSESDTEASRTARNYKNVIVTRKMSNKRMFDAYNQPEITVRTYPPQIRCKKLFLASDSSSPSKNLEGTVSIVTNGKVSKQPEKQMPVCMAAKLPTKLTSATKSRQALAAVPPITKSAAEKSTSHPFGDYSLVLISDSTAVKAPKIANHTIPKHTDISAGASIPSQFILSQSTQKSLHQNAESVIVTSAPNSIINIAFPNTVFPKQSTGASPASTSCKFDGHNVAHSPPSSSSAPSRDFTLTNFAKPRLSVSSARVPKPCAAVKSATAIVPVLPNADSSVRNPPPNFPMAPSPTKCPSASATAASSNATSELFTKPPYRSPPCRDLTATSLSPSIPSSSKTGFDVENPGYVASINTRLADKYDNYFYNPNGSRLNVPHLHLDDGGSVSLRDGPDSVASCSTPYKGTAPRLSSVFNILDYKLSDSDDDDD